MTAAPSFTPTLASTAIFWLLALMPGLLHPLLLRIYTLRFRERKNLISDLLDRSAKAPADRRRREGQRQKEEWQGRLDLNLPSYLLPVLIASILSVSAAVVMLAINLQNNELRLPGSLLGYIKLATPAAVAGFAGAYVWGLYDFVDRFRTLSLPTGALHMLWFRLLLGPIMGAYAQQLLNKDFASVFAFALASMPVPSILKWMQDTATQRFSIGGQLVTVPPKWELVQGMTPDIISRLNEVGVSSIAYLGNQDPVNLLRRTNIDWRSILDMMDQAYLARYVDDAINKLRIKGIGGAIEMAVLADRLQSQNPDERATALAVIASIAPDLSKDEAGVKNLIENLSEDPQVQRIWALWSQPDSDQSSKPPLIPFPPPDQRGQEEAGGALVPAVPRATGN